MIRNVISAVGGIALVGLLGYQVFKPNYYLVSAWIVAITITPAAFISLIYVGESTDLRRKTARALSFVSIGGLISIMILIVTCFATGKSCAELYYFESTEYLECKEHRFDTFGGPE